MERVLAGHAISRSPRLRELLAYLCEWTHAHNGTPLNEEQIGVAVFGRHAGYDTTSDTIVRVQISHLRKKLEQHFQTDGLHEPVVIELPKRTYAAVFRPRDQAAEPAAEEPAARPLSRLALVLAAALLVCVAAVVWLAADNVRLRQAAGARNPVSDRFLRQAFDGRPAQIVVSDATTMALNDYLDHLVTPQEYLSSGFPFRLLDSPSISKENRGVLQRLLRMNLTTLQDAQMASQLVQRMVPLGIPTSIVFARDFRFRPPVPENLILIGHRKANPWTALFEERLNFQYRWDPAGHTASIVNRAPAAGELAEYPVHFAVEGYAVLALLPKPGGEGAVLLLEGGDMGSPLAAAAFVCRDDRIAGLYARLGIRPGDPVPWFEALIRTKLAGNVVHQANIIAHRVIPR